MINVVCACRLKLSHQDLGLLANIRSPLETDHVNRKVCREAVQTGLLRVFSISVQSGRSFRDFLIQSLQIKIRNETKNKPECSANLLDARMHKTGLT